MSSTRVRTLGTAERVVLDVWPALLALVLCLPLLVRPGHPLARDLVFVPHQPWSDAVVGLGDSAPRAVPLDAVVSLLTGVGPLDGGVLARVVLPLVLATAGLGAHRMMAGLGTTARLVAGGFAVWNPYVVERLALGQWALLAGYAALPWLVVALRRYAAAPGRRGLGPVTGWLALASLTPTGGLLGLLMVATIGLRRPPRSWVPLAVGLLLQLPWLLPSLLGTAARRSDPSGVLAFSAGSEGPGGVLTALLGLGGIWDAGSVPLSRDGWWGPAAAVAAVVVLLVGWRRLATVVPRAGLAAAAGIGLLLALASSVPGGASAMGALVEAVPGGGLLRDSHKFLAPYAVLLGAAFGAAAQEVLDRAVRHGREAVLAVVLVAVPLPLLLLPDGAATVWPTVDPVRGPGSVERVLAAVDDDDLALATLPWRSYRRLSWGNGKVSSDPAVRLLDRPVLVSDDLVVSGTVVRGESPRAARLGRDLTAGPAHDALAAAGVGWALVYLDDPAAEDLDLTGLVPVVRDDVLALYRVPGVTEPLPRISGWRRGVVLGTDLVLGLALAGLALSAMAGAVRRRGSRPGPGRRKPPRPRVAC